MMKVDELKWKKLRNCFCFDGLDCHRVVVSFSHLFSGSCMPHFRTSNLCCLLFTSGLLFQVMGNVSPLVAQDWNWAIPGIGETGSNTQKPDPEHISVGIPGEFEPQAGLVLSWMSDEVGIIGTLLEIGQHASKQAPVIVLVNSPSEREHAELAFETAKINPRHVRFLEAPVDTIWARDFGPVVVRNADGSAHFVDSDYDDGDRPQDDNIPPVLAAAMGAKCKRSLLSIEGGNLLSNGEGLCLTTSKTVADNVIRGYEHPQIQPLFKKVFQCRDVAVLEPLVGEPTGHVDMFAAFTAPNTVVIARLDPSKDPVNAAVLDRNAKKLAGFPTLDGPLQVERIPMPAQADGLWRSFTNVLFFNGVLMMPTYKGVDNEMERTAAETFRRLLPGWKVEGIDCTKLIRMGGAVHCVTLNLPDLKAKPKRRAISVQQAPHFPAVPRNDRQRQIDPRREAEYRPEMFRSDKFRSNSFKSSPPSHPFQEDRSRMPNRDFGAPENFERLPMFSHPNRKSFQPSRPMSYQNLGQ